ncbi:MAG TPA: DoxX family protein [Bacteroidales bacterium]|nr:DoxX family protein [Bacteroidales bacterium]
MENIKNNRWTTGLVTLLRVAIGWHFLYEGLVKILAGNWTSESYLLGTSGFLSGFYHGIAGSPVLLKAADLLNMYGLLLIGIALFIGLFVRLAAWSGVLLLVLYYFAYPPFGSPLMDLSEGHLFVVNRLFIEAIALAIIAIIRNKGYSVDNLLNKITPSKSPVLSEQPVQANSRREALKNLATLPFLGVLGWGALRSYKTYGADVMSGATIQLKQTALKDLKGVLPKGKIGKHEISRLVMGGNLIGGWAHSRDLIYVPSLFKAYNTEKKVFETLMLCEQAGIDTINIGFPSGVLLEKYKKITGSKLKVITQVAPNMEKNDYYEFINKAVDQGSDIIQIQGNQCDFMVRDNKPEILGMMLEKIRSHGLTAGMGAHTVDAFIKCEELGIIPDYYMQTMHHDRYWSAHPMENRVAFEVDGERHLDHNRFHDNCFCLFPDRTVEFVNRIKVPVMGFKVLAAGAIEPKDGFRWAFENGADFICVGMFDFQVVEDVNIALEVLGSLNRKREWMA